uniref:Uncharacterized protein n=1 Tax=Arundo donax TaxID=35708 RepID=A0A0A9GSM0_ARUDO
MKACLKPRFNINIETNSTVFLHNHFNPTDIYQNGPHQTIQGLSPQ